MKTTHSHAKFISLPEWTMPTHGAHADATDLFAALSLAGWERQWIRLPASVQRRFLGFPVFGKQAVRIGFFDASSFEVCRTVCFGTDSHGGCYHARDVDRQAALKRTFL